MRIFALLLAIMAMGRAEDYFYRGIAHICFQM